VGCDLQREQIATSQLAALVQESKIGKAVARSDRVPIRTAHETGIPSSVMRLRMMHASRASAT
jgi:hypothetical protein